MDSILAQRIDVFGGQSLQHLGAADAGGWYPDQPDDPFYELDWGFLHEHAHILQRHWERAWREGRV
jgi:hypothetical protein